MVNPYGAPEITVKQVDDKRKNGDSFVWLDVREAEEVAPADLGMSVRALNEQEHEVLAETINGVVVSEVEPGGAAGTAGIEEGDLILEAGGNATTSPAALGAAVKAAKASGRPLRVRVASVDWSSGRMGTRYVALKLKD